MLTNTELENGGNANVPCYWPWIFFSYLRNIVFN